MDELRLQNKVFNITTKGQKNYSLKVPMGLNLNKFGQKIILGKGKVVANQITKTK